MMGRQFSYFLFPEDILEIEKYFKKRGDVLFLESGMFENELKIIDTLICKHFWNTLRLVKSNQIELIKIEYIKTQEYYLVNRDSSVIEMKVVDSLDYPKILKIGRFYYQPKYYENGEYIAHNQEFVKWAESIYKDVKKMFKLGKGVFYHKYGITKNATLELKDYYLSERSKKYIEEGGELNFI